jgi:hypothetical protein
VATQGFLEAVFLRSVAGLHLGTDGCLDGCDLAELVFLFLRALAPTLLEYRRKLHMAGGRIRDSEAHELGDIRMQERGPWFLTRTGKKFHPFNCRVEDLDLADIIPALANLPRFNGHTEFHSVAAHSYWVSKLMPEDQELKLWALLHDVAEAYIGDVPRPIKQCLPDFLYAEEGILLALSIRFDLPWPIPEEVHYADRVILATEVRDLYPPELYDEFGFDVEPCPDFKICSWKPSFARCMLDSQIRHYLKLGS